MVHGILSHFAIESEIGTSDHLTFRGFLLLLGALGVDLEQFAECFQAGEAEVGLDALMRTRRILMSFALRSVQVQDFMTFAEVFELLREIGMSQEDFLVAFQAEAPPEGADVQAEALLAEMLPQSWEEDGVRVATFSDVFALLHALGLDLQSFVAAHCGRALSEGDVVEEALTMLRNFVQNLRVEERLSYRDIHWILESIGETFVEFIAKFSKTRAFPRLIDDEDGFGAEGSATVGSYRLIRVLSEGMTGSVLYIAEQGHSAGSGKRTVLKYPVRAEELEVLAELRSASCSSRGGGPLDWPLLLDAGEHAGKRYLVMPLLGTSLDAVFQRLSLHVASLRWGALRVIGRLVLRALWKLHRRGFVHCDVSPHNIVLGQRRYAPGGHKDGMLGEAVTLHLVDFGCARCWPGGGAAAGDEGSMEFSSVRSAAGGERGPEDDIEALAWMLVYGVCGTLPWFPWLNEFYQLKHSLKDFKRPRLLEHVAAAKRAFLREGAAAFGEEWSHLGRVPAQLESFLQACCAQEERSCGEEVPDYSLFLQLLADDCDKVDDEEFSGGGDDDDPTRGEMRDCTLFYAVLAPLM